MKETSIIGRDRAAGGAWSGAWQQRWMVLQVARREFRSRYASSSLGLAWTVVEPLVQFLLYYFLFGMVLGTRLESGAGRGGFGLSLFVGLVPFLALQECVVRTASLGRTHAPLIRHVRMPASALVAGTIGAVMARYSVFLVVGAAACVASGTVAATRLPWLAVGIIVLIAWCWGLGLMLLPAGAYLPDLANAAPTVMTIAFFLTPVVYPPEVVPARLQEWLAFHPILGVVDLFRHALIGTGLQASNAVSAIVMAGVFCALGSLIYAKRAASLADVV